MKESNREAIFISILLGTLLPLVYTTIVAPLSAYLPNRLAKHYIGFPVPWPVFVAYALAPTRFSIPQVSESLLILFIIVGNVLVYSTIVYFMLLAFSRRKTISDRPPTPTQSSE